MKCLRDGMRPLLGIAGFFLSAGMAVFGAEGDTPLHLAALRGDAAEVRSLLARPVTVDPENSAGATPLLYGVGNLAITRMLIEHGANPNHAAKSGLTSQRWSPRPPP